MSEFWSFLDPETPSNGHIWALKWPKNEPKIIFQREARSSRKRAKRLKCGGYASRAAAPTFPTFPTRTSTTTPGIPLTVTRYSQQAPQPPDVKENALQVTVHQSNVFPLKTLARSVQYVAPSAPSQLAPARQLRVYH